MIYGLGVDIIQIVRVARALERTPALATRILTPAEYQLFQQTRDPVRFLAKRFAAKEAVVKALGTGIGQGVGWQQMQIDKTPQGRPCVTLTGHAQQLAEQFQIRAWHLSYSDEKDYVVATAIAES